MKEKVLCRRFFWAAIARRSDLPHAYYSFLSFPFPLPLRTHVIASTFSPATQGCGGGLFGCFFVFFFFFWGLLPQLFFLLVSRLPESVEISQSLPARRSCAAILRSLFSPFFFLGIPKKKSPFPLFSFRGDVFSSSSCNSAGDNAALPFFFSFFRSEVGAAFRRQVPLAAYSTLQKYRSFSPLSFLKQGFSHGLAPPI